MTRPQLPLETDEYLSRGSVEAHDDVKRDNAAGRSGSVSHPMYLITYGLVPIDSDLQPSAEAAAHAACDQ